ncbi:ThiF family adenylyltransferase [Shinella zoogloeoides]|uniref:ThiF family adenylyltransferase n=1 Tax=Shinella zoogloeoides TaxID=352475 RepID=UPI0028ABCF0B|nr:ThiF family adenylyltransferase [Shinella zoogloeoides]
MAFPTDEIDAWFATQEEFFLGRLTDDHTLVRFYDGIAWRGKTMGEFLIIVIDRDFPYSKPLAFIENYDLKRPQPHVEPIPQLGGIARLCLQTPAIPNNPLAAIQSAFMDARELLKANDAGSEDHDFEDDFGAYWRHYLPAKFREAKLHGMSEIPAGFGFFCYRNESYYCFPNKVSLRRWHTHLTDRYVRDPLRFPVIELTRLPRPDRYPSGAASMSTLLKRYTADGVAITGAMLRACPSRVPIILAGTKPDGSRVAVGVELVRRRDLKGRPLEKARVQAKLADNDVLSLYDVAPLNTRHLDSALCRMPDPALASVQKKVAIVGCGALGSGIAVMLAKAGVSRLILVDQDVLGWENIRRHELGAEWVGMAKARALKSRIEKSIPDIERVDFHACSIQALLRSNPNLLDGVDLVISATGDWGTDVFISDAVAQRESPLPTLYTWMEAYALAGHSVVLSGSKGRFTDGFDEVGNFKGKASVAGLKLPPECGNTTSPFGAVELAQSQAVASRLALETLAGRHKGDIWRTWTAEDTVVRHAEGVWTGFWLEKRGQPPALGGVSDGMWEF